MNDRFIVVVIARPICILCRLIMDAPHIYSIFYQSCMQFLAFHFAQPGDTSHPVGRENSCVLSYFGEADIICLAQTTKKNNCCR